MKLQEKSLRPEEKSQVAICAERKPPSTEVDKMVKQLNHVPRCCEKDPFEGIGLDQFYRVDEVFKTHEDQIRNLSKKCSDAVLKMSEGENMDIRVQIQQLKSVEGAIEEELAKFDHIKPGLYPHEKHRKAKKDRFIATVIGLVILAGLFAYETWTAVFG